MSRARKSRTRRLRRKESAILKFGTSAGPRHKRRGGRTGRSMRSERSVRT